MDNLRTVCRSVHSQLQRRTLAELDDDDDWLFDLQLLKGTDPDLRSKLHDAFREQIEQRKAAIISAQQVDDDNDEIDQEEQDEQLNVEPLDPPPTFEQIMLLAGRTIALASNSLDSLIHQHVHVLQREFREQMSLVAQTGTELAARALEQFSIFDAQCDAAALAIHDANEAFATATEQQQQVEETSKRLEEQLESLITERVNSESLFASLQEQVDRLEDGKTQAELELDLHTTRLRVLTLHEKRTEEDKQDLRKTLPQQLAEQQKQISVAISALKMAQDAALQTFTPLKDRLIALLRQRRNLVHRVTEAQRERDAFLAAARIADEKMQLCREELEVYSQNSDGHQQQLEATTASHQANDGEVQQQPGDDDAEEEPTAAELQELLDQHERSTRGAAGVAKLIPVFAEVLFLGIEHCAKIHRESLKLRILIATARERVTSIETDPKFAVERKAQIETMLNLLCAGQHQARQAARAADFHLMSRASTVQKLDAEIALVERRLAAARQELLELEHQRKHLVRQNALCKFQRDVLEMTTVEIRKSVSYTVPVTIDFIKSTIVDLGKRVERDTKAVASFKARRVALLEESIEEVSTALHELVACSKTGITEANVLDSGLARSELTAVSEAMSEGMAEAALYSTALNELS